MPTGTLTTHKVVPYSFLSPLTTRNCSGKPAESLKKNCYISLKERMNMNNEALKIFDNIFIHCY